VFRAQTFLQSAEANGSIDVFNYFTLHTISNSILKNFIR